MRIPPPDPLTTILLYLSAIQMALNAALAPGTPIAKAHPELALTGFWPYIPLGLLALATIIWIVRSGGRPPAPKAHIAPANPNLPTPIVQIVQADPAAPPSPREPWHSKLNGVQLYILIYMGMFFLYQIAQLIFSHKK